MKNKILTVLPNDKPITAIQVLLSSKVEIIRKHNLTFQIIENLEKCPPGFRVISRTYDQDQDADLRESSIFKIGPTRYLCVSKTEGLPNFVIQNISVLSEKSIPPRGCSVLNKTIDTEQKAWKKKQLCYRLVNLRETQAAITDIIICSRLKKAPEGFSFAG